MSAQSVRKHTIRLINAYKDTQDYPLPAAGLAITEIVLKNNTLTLRPRSWLPEGESLNVIIAVLHSSPSQISLESRVEGCSVHSPSTTARNHDILALPVSEENEYSNTYLRNGDTAKFQYHHFRLTLSTVDMPPADVDRMVEQLAESYDESVESQTIAVKQPAPTTPDENIDSDDDAGSETESENDINSSPAAPTTAPTTVSVTTGIIAESPAGQKLNRQPIADSSAAEPDTTSPLYQKSRDSQTGGETQAQGDLLMRQTFSVEANDDMVMQSTKKTAKTYANGRRSATSAVNTPNLHDSDDEGDEIAVARPKQATMPDSSDLVEPRQVAQKAASRSIPAGSKRKVADEDEDEENMEVKPVPSPKKRQKGLPKASIPEDDEKPSPRRMRPSTQVATLRSSPVKAKAKKAAGKSQGKRAATVGPSENIVLAPRSSSRSVSPTKPSPSKSKKGKKGKASAPPPAPAPPPSTPAKVSSILLSSAVTVTKAIMALLQKHSIKKIADIPVRKTDFICVVPIGKLATTAKVLRSLVLGKLVVTEDWLIDSADQQKLLDPENYLHPNLPKDEMEIDRSTLFAGTRVWFTKQLHTDYSDGYASVEALVKEAGALEVSHGATVYAAGAIRRGDIFFGSKGKDADVVELRDKDGQTVYSKDMLTQSIFTGELDLESDAFELKAPAGATKAGNRKR
ncbi:hypothetical protein LTR10_009443 [Elasticomyces elasticus]|nr:hypothetical protein LTR10_009443 [Elasticomyces elasticus]KAK4971457.1 hypothetical protein LTR42_007185 [Elasticomyces elasticus]